jgi:hypothetical protein
MLNVYLENLSIIIIAINRDIEKVIKNQSIPGINNIGRYGGNW